MVQLSCSANLQVPPDDGSGDEDSVDLKGMSGKAGTLAFVKQGDPACVRLMRLKLTLT